MKDNLLVQFILPKKDIKQITKTSLNNLFSGTVFFIFNGAKNFLIALNIEKWCFREKNKLEVFDFKTIMIVLSI